MAFLDDVAKGDKRNFEQWKKNQYYKDRKAKEKKKQLALGKKEVALAKETRNLVRDQQKTLKSNTGKLLEGLGLTTKENHIIRDNLMAAKELVAADKFDSADAKEKAMVEQKGWNLAAEARKQALIDIEMGVDFDAESYTQDLTTALEEAGVKGDEVGKILKEAGIWGKNAATVIDKAGGGEDFAKKLTMSKDSLSSLDMFEEKIFKIKGFFQDKNFRGMLSHQLSI